MVRLTEPRAQLRGLRQAVSKLHEIFPVRDLVLSPYSIFAGLTCGLLCPLWTTTKWHEATLALLPDAMGFSLGAYAIFLGLGAGFLALLDPPPGHESVGEFGFVNCLFTWLLLTEALALLVALLAGSWITDGTRPLVAGSVGFVGLYFFLMAGALGVGVVLALFQLGLGMQEVRRFQAANDRVLEALASLSRDGVRESDAAVIWAEYRSLRTKYSQLQGPAEFEQRCRVLVEQAAQLSHSKLAAREDPVD